MVGGGWEGKGGRGRDGKGEEMWGHLLNAFVLLLLGFEALAGGDGCLEVWRCHGD